MRRTIALVVFCLGLCAAGPSLAERSVEAERAWRQAASLIEQGMQSAALEPMRRATELAPDDVRIHTEYQDLMQAQGYGVDAVAKYEARRDRNPSDPDAHYLYGRSTGDPAIAKEEFERALELQPGHVWATQGLGGVAAVEGRLDDALGHYAAALALDPTRADIHNKVAGIHYARGDVDAALAAWREAMTHAPSDYHAYLNMGAVLSMTGDLEGAAQMLSQAVERAPGNPLAYVNYGYVLFKLQRYEDSLANFAAALAINPRDRKVAGSRQLVQQVRDGVIPFEAFGPYEKALAASAVDPAAAVQHFKEVLLLAPQFAVAHMNLGLMQLGTGDVDAGIASMRKAVELAPDDVATRYNLGYVLLGMEQVAESRTHLEAARAIDPGDVDVLSALALSHLGSGDVDASVAAYTKAIDLRPRDPILWVQLSSAQGAAGDLEAAATSVLEALEIAPGFADARVQLVAILREGRHFDEALAELEPLEAMSPGHPDIAAQRAALEAARDALAEAASKPGHIRLSRIYVRDQAAADALSGKLADERPFETLARDYGEGPERLRAGDIGFMDPADLRPELADVVTTLAVGDVTPVVDLGGAWVVIKRTE